MFNGVIVVYFVASFLTSLYVKKERSKQTKVTEKIKFLFVDAPFSFDFNFPIKIYNKYLVELVLFFLLVIMLVGTNLFFTNQFIKLIQREAELELFFGIVFMQFIFVVASGYVIYSLQESFILFKKFNKLSIFEVRIDKGGIYIPFFLLEGLWREITTECDKSVLYLKYEDLLEFIVEPSRGIKRVTPPYFKIKIKDHDEYIFIQRRLFKKQEKPFVECIKDKLPIKIIFNDTFLKVNYDL